MLKEFFDQRVNDAAALPWSAEDDYVVLFLSTSVHKKVNTFLREHGLALTAISPTGTGGILISRERIDHVLDSRSTKDGVTEAGVLELLDALFAQDGASWGRNQSGGARKGGYDTQLTVFRDRYKSKAMAGWSPVAIVSVRHQAPALLKIETAYWADPHKIKALLRGAL